jgi:hypothetical protein
LHPASVPGVAGAVNSPRRAPAAFAAAMIAAPPITPVAVSDRRAPRFAPTARTREPAQSRAAGVALGGECLPTLRRRCAATLTRTEAVSSHECFLEHVYKEMFH